MIKVKIMILVLLIAFSLGCVTKSVPEANTTPTSTISATVITPTATATMVLITPVPTPLQTDDVKFVKLVTESADILNSDANGLSQALIYYNYDTLVLYGQYLRDDSKRYIDNLSSLKISSSLEPAFDEYNQSLSIYYSVGSYAAGGDAWRLNDNGRVDLVDTLSTGTAHITRAITILKRDSVYT